jgi:hypothetical protein
MWNFEVGGDMKTKGAIRKGQEKKGNGGVGIRKGNRGDE